MKQSKRLFALAIIISMVMAFAPVALAEEGEKLNINKASVEALMQLKGIGQSYAERIVDYREKNGSFEKIEDIMKIKGIGAKTFESIKDLITAE